MKNASLDKFIFSLMMLFAILTLASCSQTPSTPPPGDAVATIVAQTLAAQPTESQGFDDTVGTIAAQTLAAQPTQAVTDTPVPPAPEPSPTQTPTEMPTATQAPTETQSPTSTASPVPTIPEGDPRQTLGGATFTDRMDNSTYWPTDTDSFTKVEFEDGAMLYTALSETDGWRMMTYPEVTDFYVEITASFEEECSGSDHFGIIARVPDKSSADRGYLFGVSCDGRFTLVEWDGTVTPNGSWKSHIAWKANDAIHKGLGEKNRVGLMATGDHLTLYVNGVKVAEFEDDTLDKGYLGIFVGSDETDDLTVRVDELNFWGLD